ncbi:hypothetical protein [Gelidibacter mesophilus]|uniref:hypothetical protein n=1 Tax=Gelidibacter mesophilus TaxID=169050 RepID=UPI000411D00F|nr:hypothetical protein [Gelidibacter mesophilus]
MEPEEILRIEKEVVLKRIEEISELVNEVRDSASRGALTNNHQDSVERLIEINRKLKELI